MAPPSRPSRRASCSAPSSRVSRSKAECSPAAASTASPRSPPLTGFALVFGYGLLGAGWLVLKTSGRLQQQVRRQGLWCLGGVIACIVAVSVWTPILDADIARRWFSWPNIVWLLSVPFATCVVALLTGLAFRGKSEAGPFAGGVALFVLSYAGIAISLWPMIVPHHYTLWQAASSPKTQAFLLGGTLFLLPTILLYTAWSYWVFRGKVHADIGYH